MKEYDAIVIGSGCAMTIVNEAVAEGWRVALVDRGPLGGTCPNVGCIPSKVLTFAADRVAEIRESQKLGITASIDRVDVSSIRKRMRKGVREREVELRAALTGSENPRFYEGEGRFVSDYVIEVNGERLKAEKIFIGNGARPGIPPIKGLDSVDYLTSNTVLDLTKKPESLLIAGGGYVGVEYAHFFAAMGTSVTLVEMAGTLVAKEEPEISRALRTALAKRMNVMTSTLVEKVKPGRGGGISARLSRRRGRSGEGWHQAEKMLVAAGRVSNADTLSLNKTGVEVNERGFIRTNEYFETSKPGIYAIGDANGAQMFTHVGDREALLAALNVIHGQKQPIDYGVMPHAVYSHPQIASVGLTEKEAKDRGFNVLVGQPAYFDTAKGEAMVERQGFAKVIVNKDTLDILGFHIVGPHAPILIQEVVNAMTSGGHADEVTDGVHIHPALAEVIPLAFSHLEEH